MQDPLELDVVTTQDEDGHVKGCDGCNRILYSKEHGHVEAIYEAKSILIPVYFVASMVILKNKAASR